MILSRVPATVLHDDTAATLRAGARGPGDLRHPRGWVYDADPEHEPDARLYTQIGYTEVLADRLQALDATAVSLAMDNRMPIVVFNMTVDGNILRALRGEAIGTLISEEVPA